MARVHSCSLLTANAFLLGMLAPLVGASEAAMARDLKPQVDSCVVIDNDFDIDDMMAIPPVLGMKHVAAIIQSEGYTYPELAAPAVDQLVNAIPDQPESRKIPIIVGARQAVSPDPDRWPWLRFFRSMMNRGNGLLSEQPKPWQIDHSYPQKLEAAVANCKKVSVLVIGTYTSFVNYLPRIRSKINRVVIMGQRIGDESHTPGRESFNCNYDFSSCQRAMPMLKELPAFFVDIPRLPGCDNTATPAASCYNPSYQMVAGGRPSHGDQADGLLGAGLPGRLRKALINSIECSSFYTTSKTIGRACSSLSTWEPVAVAKGPGGEMLLWDQTAAHFLIRPEDFSLHYPDANPAIGGTHYHPTLIDGSYEKTVKHLRRSWTEFSNQSIRIK